ncbi:MAG: hypothetical protein A3H72_00120 [Candidatus Doudnabacteria bacterium RIFCSPLOWO2_02_FULL_48_8]|uniref:Phosphatase n=1 Tax=Candidatus Doudnabacteria bacterium RIFCSPHIGHO2_01_FULL_46_24 TaxID=1817825 RepID=A0A1F5NTW3_9BACT|nr:MAG: hypothetical protein A2720_01040 [Candidatus Doudnabacteria bacterium RIFCSPHIGHO2_01_FULL_46_24]OGE95478.1 MAG: hypothetical protein A3E98_01125 [Candidatus Doudnabacteria bacterium RIFCSPHIGHO2_12_FULL_48_11]OGE95566.1 MAG: hypothetical protein A3H72_00120 [Candidatus Doudnabacteria bacterium RIFCSPLOWO2_02_FULL_48_8]
MIKLVAFDWNGTILSDAAAVSRADSATAKHFGFSGGTIEEYRATFTIPIRNYWIARGFDLKFFDRNAEKIHKYFLNQYEPLEDVCRSRAGTRPILAWLRKMRIKSVIYSNHIIPHIEKQLWRLELHGYVDKIMARPTSDDHSHMHNRFKQLKLYDYVKKFKLKPKEVLLVGDTVEEIENAKYYGYYSVALTGGHNSTVRLRAVNPDFLIDNLNELKVIIPGLSRQRL